MPVYARKFVALGQKDRPQNVKDGFVFPAHEGAVDVALMAELLGQMVPLAARPHAEDDAVKAQTRIGAWASHTIGRIIDRQHFFDQLPERIGCVPDS